MTREDILRLLKVISDNYNIKIADPKGKASAWEMELSDYSAEAIYKAARLHMATSSYFPTPADLINKIVRAEIIYSGPQLKAIDAVSSNNEKVDEYLEAFCKWIGFGCEPDDSIDLSNFLPYER